MNTDVQSPLKNKPRFSTVFILGLGHSGSTLLGRMLGCHPDVSFVGELLRLEQALARPEERCSCGAAVQECNVWQRRLAALPPSVKSDYRGWNLNHLAEVRKAEGKAMLVDSSKSRVLRLESRWRDSDSGYVLLVRDPRGAMRSALRETQDLTRLLRSNHKWMRRYETFSRRNPSVCLTMFYEDLVTRTQDELQRLCGFLQLPFNPRMLHPDQDAFHVIRASRSPYLKGANQLKTDDRWRSELTDEQTQAISHHLGTISIYQERYGLKRLEGSGGVVGWGAGLLRKLRR